MAAYSGRTPVNVMMKCDPVSGGNETGTVVTAPGTVPSAMAGSATCRTWLPEVIVRAVGTECRPSAMTCMANPLSACGLARS